MPNEVDDALGLAQRIRAKELSAREAVTEAIARIERMNPEVNAVTSTRFDQALDDVERGLPDGPLTGVPFLVKDIHIDVAGLPSTRGSRLFRDRYPAYDSVLAARYKQAGLVILGMTNLSELGTSPTTEPLERGPVRNPWRPTHAAGGSSGGSAAAVASGMVPAAHGNDGGGSIRIPASMCGTFGLKPTRGRVPAAPYDTSFSFPLAIDHALTATVRDSAVLLDVVAGPILGSPYAPPRPERPYADEVGRDPGPLSIALSTSAHGELTDPACASAAESAAQLCELLGHRVHPVDFDYDVAAARTSSAFIMSANTARTIDAELAAQGRELSDDDLEPFTRYLVEFGRTITAAEVLDALETVERLGRGVAPFFGEHDILVTPTIGLPPPPLGLLDTSNTATMIERAGQYTNFTSIFNITGQPSMSVPFGTAEGGLPVGVQFTARLGAEDLLFRVAAQIEQAAPWPLRAPGFPQ